MLLDKHIILNLFQVRNVSQCKKEQILFFWRGAEVVCPSASSACLVKITDDGKYIIFLFYQPWQLKTTINCVKAQNDDFNYIARVT